MTTTSTAIDAATPADLSLTQLISGIRSIVARDLDWDATAKLVADELAMALPHIHVLTPAQRLGSAERYTHHTLYVDPSGQFSILAIVWRPGQHTGIHDHVTWCALGVLQGAGDEELFDADLNLVGRNVNRVGDVSGFAPPGDIHRITNTGDVTVRQDTSARVNASATRSSARSGRPAPAITARRQRW
jgi:predicted metal-dependent enzyme (double-stranded beta helix superfamily)